MQLAEEFISAYKLNSIIERCQGRNLEMRMGTEAMGDCFTVFLLEACSACFYHTQDHVSKEWHYPQWAGLGSGTTHNGRAPPPPTPVIN